MDTLFVASIKYAVNGGSNQFQVWNGALAQNETDTILLAGIPANGTAHTFFVSSINPNNSADINTQNDAQATTFSTQYGNKINLELVTDNYGFETSWKLFDINFNLIAKGDSLASNTFYQHNFCLEDGCYIFVIS